MKHACRAIALAAVTLLAWPAPHGFGQTNTGPLIFPGENGRLIYRPDGRGNRLPDFSQVGFRHGNEPLPDVPFLVESNRWVFVNPTNGPADTLIQAALNTVSNFTLNPYGFRGVVQLAAGEYLITNRLDIRRGGIVLRGVGDGANTNSNTLLRSTTTEQVSLIFVDNTTGSLSKTANTEHNLTDKYVPVGATSFRVDSTANWSVGDRVVVERPATSNWIADLGMDMIPQNSDGSVVQWSENPSSHIQRYERVLTRIEGDRVFLNAPLPNSFEQQYGGGTVARYTYSRIAQVGIENLRGQALFLGATNETHAWSFIEMRRVEDCWVRNITARHFGFAAVLLGTQSLRVTAQGAACIDPQSIITGQRRYAFNNQGQLSLTRDLFSSQGRHDFVNNSPSRGPNVFFNGLATNTFSESGPHQRWSTGTLYDNLAVPGDALAAWNRGNFGTGHGWSGANMVFWNCRAGIFRVENPFTAQNWVIGCIGTAQNPSDFLNAPFALYHSHGTNVPLGDPIGNPLDSLYLAQLNERLADRTVQTREYLLGDFDRFEFDGTNSVDTVPVDPAWRAAIQPIVGSAPTARFDVASNDVYVPFTFDFQLDPGDSVVGASLTLALRRVAGATTNDSLWIESTTNRLTFPSLGLTANISTNPNAATLLIYEFPPGALTNLADGRLNALIGDDVSVDWALLRLHVATIGPPIVTALEPEADAFVRDGPFATDNFGADTVLTVKDANQPDVRRESYLRFNLAGVAGNVVDAKVRLRVSSVSDPVMNAAAFVADDSWTETGITWTNRPPSGEPFAQWSPQAGEFVEFPVTSFVRDAVAGDGRVSFRILSQSITTNGFVNYNSRESSLTNRPQLIFTVSNTPPALSAFSNRTINEDASTGPIAFTVGDLESPAGALVVSGAASNQTLVPNPNIVFGGGGANRTVTLTPATNQSGTNLITIRVTDPQGLSATRSFLLTVNPVNDPPVLAPIADRTRGAGQWLVLTNVVTDPDPGDTHTFSLLSAPASAAITPDTGVVTWRPPVAQADSTNLFRVRVADNGAPSLSATQQFNVFVNPLAEPAVAQMATDASGLELLVSGDPGPDYTLLASTNLTDWQVIAVFSNVAVTPFPWLDTNSSGFQRRFYRVLLGP